MTEERKIVKASDKPWLNSYKVGPYPLKASLEPYPRMPLHKILDNSAAEYSNNVAIRFLGREIRYGELKLYTDKLAHALVDLGVKRGDRVATVLQNCPQFLIADFAISKAGGVHVPCSTLHRALDLEYEIGESEAELVICSVEAIDLINSIKDKLKLKHIIVTSHMEYSIKPPERGEIPGAYQFRDLLAEYEPSPPNIEIDPAEDLACLAFTGGSTGIPKGVMSTHYSLVTNVFQGLLWMLSPLERGVKGKAGIEVAVPLFHAYGHLSALSAIAWGLQIFLVSDPRDTDQIVNLMKEYRPLIVSVVPTHLMRIAERKIGRLPVMLVSGAAPLPSEVFDAILRDIMMPVTEGYGLTECGPVTHMNPSCFSRITGFVGEVTYGIGVPVPDTEVRIVDPQTDEELNAGESGEILVRGPQLMKGYWPAPGSGLANGWLRTGDIGRMDEKGYFVIEDRVKDMANVSGYKVYTTQIDDVLFKYPGVAMAAAVGIPDPDRSGSERIKVFIRPKEEYKGKLNAENIIEYCKERLAPYAVPKYIEFRDDLPLTATQKIFKRALREEEIEKAKEQEIVKLRGEPEIKRAL